MSKLQNPHFDTASFKIFRLDHHLFADDNQAYASTMLDGVDDVRSRLHDCTTDISNWCASRRLQLNENKTELAWFGKRSQLNENKTKLARFGKCSRLKKLAKIKNKR